MTVVPEGYEEHLRKAVLHYWQTLRDQAGRKGAGPDTGNRSAVTGGKQMNGFCSLVHWALEQNGMPDASIYVRRHLDLPGFYRATKKWDLLVVHDGGLVAVTEFKSQVGPSFGNNMNNRAEEALGNATDLWTAYREGAFGAGMPRPWAGWMVFLEDCAGSSRPVGVEEPHFKTFKEFHNSSYAKRWELLLQKLVREQQYDAAALVLSSREAIDTGAYTEPAHDLSVRRFLAGLGGHVRTFLESV